MRRIAPLLALACTGCAGWNLSWTPLPRVSAPVYSSPTPDYALPIASRLPQAPPTVIESKAAPAVTLSPPAPEPPQTPAHVAPPGPERNSPPLAAPAGETEVRVDSGWTAADRPFPTPPADPFEE